VIATVQRLGIVTGMVAEARCIAPGGGPVEIRIQCSGARAEGARRAAATLVREGAQALLSFGIAGGLHEDLRPGHLVLAHRVLSAEGGEIPHDPAWRTALLRALAEAGIPVRLAAVVGSDLAAATPHRKRALYAQTGAHAVDMESHIVAEVASRAGLRFAALRAVADPAHRTIPWIALAGLRADGTMDPLAVLARLTLRPRSLPALLRLGHDSARALASLRRVGSVGLLGASLQALPNRP
jgi:adenosylhomocysteine nucleosidase